MHLIGKIENVVLNKKKERESKSHASFAQFCTDSLKKSIPHEGHDERREGHEYENVFHKQQTH